MKDLVSLENKIETELEKLGLNLVELSKFKAGSSSTLRITINDPLKHVSHDQCTSTVRLLQESLPELNEEFNLEVWSPGVGRELTSDRDFQIFKGKLIEISFVDSKQAHVIGILKDKDTNSLMIGPTSVKPKNHKAPAVKVVAASSEQTFSFDCIQKVTLAHDKSGQEENTTQLTEISVEDI